MRRALRSTGRSARVLLAHVGNVASLAWAVAGVFSRLPSLNWRVVGRITLSQIRFGGLHAVPLVAAMAAGFGAVGIMQFFTLLAGLADELVGKLLVTIVVREMGPLITGIVLIARSGTAVATELGAMRLEGELEALEAYRIDPVSFVVFPRVLGMAVSLMCLIVVFDVVGLLGGAAIASLLRGLSFHLVSVKVHAALTNLDLGLSLLKAVLFGFAISLLPCYFGLMVRRSTTELPQAVTKAVVASLAAMFFMDAALAALFIL